MSNTKILEKAIAELKKESFSKEYVLGMLETLVEMQSNEPQSKILTENRPKVDLTPSKEVDTAEMLDKLAKARLKEVEEATTIDVVIER